MDVLVSGSADEGEAVSDIDPKSLDPKFREELRKHAWEYFKLHAEQRTRVFNFYVLLTVAMVAGLLTVLKEAPAVPYAASAICVMIAFFSFIFLQLDTRTRSLVANAERALVMLEEDERLPDSSGGVPHPGRLFTREAYERKRASEFNIVWTYTHCFRTVFIVMGILSAFGLVVILSR
jgi:hypothetical protein